jgi:MFS family permease
VNERGITNLAPERVRWNLRVDIATAVVGATMSGFVVPFMPVMVRRMGGSDFEVSLVIAAAFFGHLLSPIGVYVLSRAPLVSASALPPTVGRAIFALGALSATTPLSLAVPYVAYYILSVANIGAYTMLMQRIYPSEVRATAMGRVRISANAAVLVASFAGGAVLQVSNDPARVLAGAGFISVAGALIFLGIRHDEAMARPRLASPLGLLPLAWADATFRRFLMASMVFGFANIVAGTIYPLLLVDRFDVSNAFVGVYTATSAAATMVGYWFWGRRIDRGSSIRLALSNTTLLLAVPAIFLVAPSAWLLLVAAAISGFNLAGGDLTFVTTVLQIAPRERVADYMAAQSFTLGLRGAIAPFVAAGLLLFIDANLILAAVIVFMAAGIVLHRGVVMRVESRRVVAPAAAS